MLFLTAAQIFLGIYLLIVVLRIPNYKKMKHRLVQLLFSMVGSYSFTAGVFYANDFRPVRTILCIIISSLCIWALHLFQKDIPMICSTVFNKVRNYCNE